VEDVFKIFFSDFEILSRGYLNYFLNFLLKEFPTPPHSNSKQPLNLILISSKCVKFQGKVLMSMKN
jgi:hypothetical protein